MYTIEEKICFSLESPNTFELMRNFLKQELYLQLENAENIEFQRAHRIGKEEDGRGQACCRSPGLLSFVS